MKLTEEPHWVLVEDPGPGDAGFLGHWLLAAVDAGTALEQQRKQNLGLEEQISRPEVVYEISFSRRRRGSPATLNQRVSSSSPGAPTTHSL